MAAALEILEQVRKQQLDDLLSALRQDQILNSEQYQSLEQQSRDVDAHDPEFAALEWLASQRLRAGGDKLIDERWLTLWWARRRGVELIYLSPSTVDLTLTAQHLSQHYCQLYKLLLVHLSDDTATLAFAEPPPEAQLQLLARLFARAVQVRAVHGYQWRGYFRSSFSIQRSFSALGSSVYSSRKSSIDLQTLRRASSAEQVVQLVDWLFEYVAARFISDVHLEARARSSLLRVRVDGQLQDLISIPNALAGRVANRLKVLAGLELTLKRTPQDGRFTLQSSGGELLQVRIAAVSSSYGEKIALRFFHEKMLFEEVGSLGMPSVQAEGWERMLQANAGLILITGPTGSGKTTTLYASLLELANRGRNVATIEDPVELMIEQLTQIQVHEQFSYADAIRSLLRQDPDVIMVGEVRDSVTAAAALQAAQTGHLVFVTVHSADSIGAVVRLLDLGVPWYLLQESLLGVLAQRLLPLLCQHCRSPYSETEKHELRQKLAWSYSAELYRAQGCGRCRMLGVKGRRPIFELLEFGAQLQQIADFHAPELAQYSYGPSLRAAAAALAHSGAINPDIVLSQTPSERAYWRQ